MNQQPGNVLRVEDLEATVAGTQNPRTGVVFNDKIALAWRRMQAADDILECVKRPGQDVSFPLCKTIEPGTLSKYWQDESPRLRRSHLSGRKLLPNISIDLSPCYGNWSTSQRKGPCPSKCNFDQIVRHLFPETADILWGKTAANEFEAEKSSRSRVFFLIQTISCRFCGFWFLLSSCRDTRRLLERNNECSCMILIDPPPLLPSP